MSRALRIFLPPQSPLATQTRQGICPLREAMLLSPRGEDSVLVAVFVCFSFCLSGSSARHPPASPADQHPRPPAARHTLSWAPSCSAVPATSSPLSADATGRAAGLERPGPRRLLARASQPQRCQAHHAAELSSSAGTARVTELRNSLKRRGAARPSGSESARARPPPGYAPRAARAAGTTPPTPPLPSASERA